MQGISDILASSVGNASQAGTGLASDFNTFLSLLTAQLQAQDPLDPLDSSEFTSQLVEFSSVEQQITANQNLENVTALLAFNGMTSAVNYLGTEVTIPQDNVNFSGEPVTWIYELDGNASNVKLEIVNRSGAVVNSLPGQIDKGAHALNWDGRDSDGQLVSPGEYRLRVKATASDDSPMGAELFVRGTVEGVEMEGGEALLAIGGFRIPITQVVAVSLAESKTTPPAA